jgi:RecB family exonuclease
MIELIEQEVVKFDITRESLEEAGTLLRYYLENSPAAAEETVATEKSFTLKLAGATIRGRIDRIVPVPDGVKVVDYKIKGEGKVDKHRNAVVARLEDVQLPVYILAAREMGHAVSGFSYVYLNYEKTNRPGEVFLRFSEDGGSATISEAQLSESVARIEQVVAQILSGSALYSKGEKAPCRQSPAYCDYSAMCTFAGE